jgi:hypothetical protein
MATREAISPTRFKLSEGRMVLEYSSPTTGTTSLDVKEEYLRLGGAVEPDTEIEFSEWFPGTPYQNTALTHDMPPQYLCEGSISSIIIKPEAQSDCLSLSVYRDLRGYDPCLGDHRNIYLQSEIGGNIDHTNKIPKRHIPLSEPLTIRAKVNDKIVIERVLSPPKVKNSVSSLHRH